MEHFEYGIDRVCLFTLSSRRTITWSGIVDSRRLCCFYTRGFRCPWEL